MDRKELIIAGIVVIIAVIAAIIIFAPSNSTTSTHIDVLNKGAVGKNSTIYIKLTDDKKTALGGKTVQIKLINNKNEVVYDEKVETHATGVALAQLKNIRAGEYKLNVTFNGDGNYSGSNISQKLTVKEGHVEDNLENSTLIQQTLADSQDSSRTSSSQSNAQSSSQSSSSSRSSSSSSSSSSDSSSSSQSSSDSSSEPTPYIDENGKEYLPEFDENGNLIN